MKGNVDGMGGGGMYAYNTFNLSTSNKMNSFGLLGQSKIIFGFP
jgi:hypothetical protein